MTLQIIRTQNWIYVHQYFNIKLSALLSPLHLSLVDVLTLTLLNRGRGHAHSPGVGDAGLDGGGRGASVVLELVVVHVLGLLQGRALPVDHGEPLVPGG